MTFPGPLPAGKHSDKAPQPCGSAGWGLQPRQGLVGAMVWLRDWGALGSKGGWEGKFALALSTWWFVMSWFEKACTSQGWGGGGGLGTNRNKDPCPWKRENQKKWISKCLFQPALLCHNVYVLTKGECLKRLWEHSYLSFTDDKLPVVFWWACRG